MPLRFHQWVATHGIAIIMTVIALSLLAIGQLVNFKTGELRLTINPSLDAISTRSPQQRKFDNLIRLRFGDSQPVLVMMRAANVFQPQHLIRLDQLSQALQKLDGVKAVDSLTATTLPLIDGDELNYARVTTQAVQDPGFTERLRRSVRDNPLISGQLVSADGTAALITVHLQAQSERTLLRSQLAQRIRQQADRFGAPDVDIFVSGEPLIRSELSDAITQQLQTVIPAILLVITGLLTLVFRNVRGVLIPLATISVALLWVLALISLLERPINLISALAPPFIITMGLAYSAHVIAEFEHLLQTSGERPLQQRITLLLGEVSLPVMVTGLATISGLLALMVNDQHSMIEFAAYSVLGTVFLMILTLVFTPALLHFSRPGDHPPALPGERMCTRGVENLSHFDLQHRNKILRVAFILFLLSLLFAARIDINDSLIGVFPEQSRIHSDHAAINQSMGGVTPMAIALQGSANDTFTDPVMLRQLERLEDWLKQQPEVGAVLGLPDHVKLLNQYLGSRQHAIPASRDIIRQLLFVGDGNWLRSVVNIDRSASLIRCRLTVDDTSQISAFTERLNQQLAPLRSGLSVRLSGAAVVMTESVEQATSGQLSSVALALLLIYLCLALQFMSLKVGLLASLPTVLQTALYFGLLGLLGISLNPTSVLVESLVLGLAIDDTIHYLSRFANAARRSGSEKIAATTALRAVLRPVTVTKTILALGFLTLILGDLSNQALFGWLAALTLFLTWLVDIFVTPAFVSGLRIVTLWDTLRLNLGDRVQQTIPLFEGLTQRQARIFALMSNLHKLPAGERLITEGEHAGDIFIVIDGELNVFTQQGQQRKELNQMRRGDVIGEIGYFGQRRSASVEASTESRLLRFNEADQERLCKAYPLIAARVFLNLNRLQAQRHLKYQSNALGYSPSTSVGAHSSSANPSAERPGYEH